VAPSTGQWPDYEQDTHEPGDHGRPAPPAHILFQKDHRERGQRERHREIDRGRDADRNVKERQEIGEGAHHFDSGPQHDATITQPAELPPGAGPGERKPHP